MKHGIAILIKVDILIFKEDNIRRLIFKERFQRM